MHGDYPSIVSLAFSFGIALVVLVLFFGGVHFLGTEWPLIIPSTGWGLAAGAGIAVAAYLFSKLANQELKLYPEGFAAGLLLFLISDIPHRKFGYYQTYWVLPELALGFLIAYFGTRYLRGYLPVFGFVAAIAAGMAGFIFTSDGRLLISDDHASFLFRLIQLKDNFPSIPFYSTEWNAGYDAREFFPSGVLNVFLIFSPIIYLFDVQAVFNIIVLLVLFVLVPACMLLAGLKAGLDRAQSSWAALLSLFSSLLWYRWGLSYGTIGFLTSMALLPLVTCLSARLTAKNSEWSIGDALLFLLATSLMVLWPIAVLAAFPLWAAITLRIVRVLSKRGMALVLPGLLLLHLPWMLIFVDASNVTTFVTQSESGKGVHAATNQPKQKKMRKRGGKKAHAEKPLSVFSTLAVAYKNLRSAVLSANPILIVLFLPGFVLLRGRLWATLYLIECIWLISLAGLGALYFPQLELERFFVVAFHLLCLPVGILLAQVGDTAVRAIADRHWISGSFGLVPLAAAIFIPQRIQQLTTNKTTEQYHFASSLFHEVEGSIKNCAEGGRVMFAGFTLHELDGGHVAPLAPFTGVPLIASSYQHNVWTYTDVIPGHFRERGTGGILEFLNLNNVTCIIVHDSGWLKWFKKHPQDFGLVAKQQRFNFFKRLKFKSNYFEEGTGLVTSKPGASISLTLQSPRAVIRFNYFDFLRSSVCEIGPFEASGGLRLIELKNCPTNEKISIVAVSPMVRLYMALSRFGLVKG